MATPELSDEAGTGARIRLELSPLADPPTGPHETPRLLEAGSELVARFDPDLRVVAVNHLVLTVSGLAPEQIIGRTNREMGYPPVIADLWDTHHRQVFRTGRPCALSYTLVTVAGPRPYESRITPEFDADGNVVAVTVRSRPSLLSTEADVPVRGDFAGADEAMWERFEPVPASVAAARARIRAWLVDRAHDPRTTEVTLAVSELATNAIMHAGTEFYVHALRDPAHVRIAVRDGSDALPVLREPGTVGGRGIPLVAALASRWGVDRMPYGGKVVWCEFLDGEPAAPPRLTDAELIDFWSEQ